MKSLLWIAAAALLASSPALGQGCSHASPYADDERMDIAPTFYDSTGVGNRGTEIQQLSSSDTSYVVHNDTVCDAVLSLAIAYMRTVAPVWTANQEGNYVATVFRFGPYFAVSIDAEEPAATYSNGVLTMGSSSTVGRLIVYDASTLTRLKVFH